jgi:caffeoyl-CoA O-methyltransferase
MSASLGLSPELVSYLAAANAEHPALARCREETGRVLPDKMEMQISPEQGAFMALIARMIHARRALEVGVFTGYSSLAVALAMQDMHGDDAHLLACDVSTDFTDRAKHYWDQASVSHVIDLEIGPAVATLDKKLAQGMQGTYDLAFIDADKESYDLYYERCLALLRSGGVILVDNMFRGGRVADPNVSDEGTRVIRDLAVKARDDMRVHAAMAGIGDGLLLCVKR